MIPSSTVSGSTIGRLRLITSRFQEGAVNCSKSEAETFERESTALAARLDRERGILKELGSNQAAWSPARVDALISLVAACLHVRDAVRPFLDGPGKLRLFDAATSWVKDSISAMHDLKLPASPREAVATALLRAKILQGCSRQLTSLADIRAPNRHTQDRPSAHPPHLSLEMLSTACTLVERLGQLVSALCQVYLFSAPVPYAQNDSSSGEQEALRSDAEDVVAQQDRGGQRTQHGAEDGALELGGNPRQPDIQKQQQQQQACGAAGTEAAQEVELHRDVLQELLAEISSSGVLEHLSRCTLLLAGRLQGEGAPGGGQAQREQGTNGSSGQQQQQHWSVNDATCFDVAYLAHTAAQAYRCLSILTESPRLLDGDGCCCCPAGGGSGGPGPGHAEIAVDEVRDFDTGLLKALDTIQGPTEVDLIRRALCGPCTRHLVLCAGLNTLCALDGGSP